MHCLVALISVWSRESNDQWKETRSRCARPVQLPVQIILRLSTWAPDVVDYQKYGHRLHFVPFGGVKKDHYAYT
jgi:hypothetical protein